MNFKFQFMNFVNCAISCVVYAYGGTKIQQHYNTTTICHTLLEHVWCVLTSSRSSEQQLLIRNYAYQRELSHAEWSTHTQTYTYVYNVLVQLDLSANWIKVLVNSARHMKGGTVYGSCKYSKFNVTFYLSLKGCLSAAKVTKCVHLCPHVRAQ